MRYDTFQVPRPGGPLAVGRWGTGDRVLVALHGLTGTHLFFQALADQLDGDGFTLVAPDMRGRGRSGSLPGPYGIAAHADDAVAVLDFLGIGDATFLGHSMGGFVAVVASARTSDRVRDLVLVDGGLPLDVRGLAGLPIEDVVKAITGPALDRLRLTFESIEAYLDYWREHPAFAGAWNPYVERLYTYDLVGTAPELHSSVSADAVLEDSASELKSGDVERALSGLDHATTLVRAERGIFNQIPPLYPDGALSSARAGIPQLEVVDVPDVNHYTILLSTPGAEAVAGVVRARLGRPG
ncbi:MAG: alpha/beta fold hydrolase [Acidimicrobiales bacterium]